MDEAENAVIPEYILEFVVPEEAIDANGHVNNVVYVQWMQDLAVKHWASLGGGDIEHTAESTWVARSHHIEYLRPAFKNDKIIARTWIHDIGKVRSTRKYSFRRAGEDKPLAQGETNWVFVNIHTGRPRAIPLEVRNILPVKEG